MRPLAEKGFTDYRNKIEQKAIEEHRSYINAQMAFSSSAPDDAQRSRHLANAIAANGMLLRGMDIGFVTGELNYQAISDLSAGIETLPAIRSLMEDGSGERLAQGGSVDALLRELHERERALSENEMQSRSASDVIRDVQVKARARTAEPRDYAMLAAAHRMSSWKGRTRAPDGKMVDVVRCDMNRRLDGRTLVEETDRVLADPDFQYLMKHEKKEILDLNALRINGTALAQYAKRVKQMKSREEERSTAEPAKAGPDAPER